MSPYVQCLLVFVFLYTAILVYGWRTVDRPSRRTPADGRRPHTSFVPGVRRGMAASIPTAPGAPCRIRRGPNRGAVTRRPPFSTTVKYDNDDDFLDSL